MIIRKIKQRKLLFAAVCMSTVHVCCLVVSDYVHSPSIDETAHLPAGISHWELGRFELYAVNPPLIRMLAAIPPMIVNPKLDWDRYSTRIPGRSEFPVGTDFVKANKGRSIWLYSLGRLSIIPISVGCLWLCLQWASELSSKSAGSMAAAIYFVSPTILANAAMLTPDVGAMFFGCFAWYLATRWMKNGGWRSAAGVGVALGFALLTKFTCLIYLALLLAASAVRCFFVLRRAEINNSVGRVIGQTLLMLGLSWYVLNSGYSFDGTGERLGSLPFVSKPLTDENGVNRFAGTVAGQVPLPVPKCYALGLDTQRSDFDAAYPSFLMGEWRLEGWWYYYLVGFLVKEPIAFQLLLYVSAVHAAWTWRKWKFETVREWSAIVVPPVLIFVLVSSQTGFNHHMRYVLPAYPFLVIIAARVMTLGDFWRKLAYALLTWQVASSLWFAPHWMSYFNEGVGGPRRGHEWLVDSNIDWGQDIQLLKWWQQEHPNAEPLQAALFTQFDPADIGLNFTLPPPYLHGQPDVVSARGFRGPQAGWFAVSVCQLKGHSFSVPDGEGGWTWSDGHFKYFLEYFEPVDMIGYSIYIYNITESQAEAVRRIMALRERMDLQQE